MKLSGITFLLLVLFLSSCNKVIKPEKPENLLSENKMVEVLVDMAIMSSAKGINKKKFEENGIVPEKYIYTKHAIDSATFQLSNDYYAYRIKKYNYIYAKVKDSLTKLKDKYKTIEDEEKQAKKKRDSIERSKVKKLEINPRLKKEKKKGRVRFGG